MSFIKQLLILLALNTLLFGFANYLHLERVFFSVDYLLCLLMFFWGYKKTGGLLLFIFCVSDILLLIRQIFPFHRLDDILYVLQFIFISSGYYQAFFVVGILLIGFFLFFYNKFIIKKYFLIYSYFFISIFYLSESIYGYINPQYKKIIFDSQILNFIDIQKEAFTQTLHLDKKELVKSNYSTATHQLYTDIKNNHINNQGVLLVVAESLGFPRDEKVLDAMLAPLNKYQDKFEYFKIKKENYNMPTVYGELRELCHAYPQNFNLKNLEKGFEDCLPHHFKKMGYDTTAMHGAMSIMYDRKYWYPRAGFDTTIFYESQQWQKQCYSFSGACDIELADMVSQTFQKPNKQFFYWLTLNSHAVYDKRDIFIDEFDCKALAIETDSESCRNLKLNTQFFASLAQLVQQKQFAGVEVIVVGDHTPAIFNQQEKEKYFDGDNVPVINFKVK